MSKDQLRAVSDALHNGAEPGEVWDRIDAKPIDSRWCYWVNETQDPTEHGGYVPSRVDEGEPGHAPMIGRGDGAAPWVWGKTLKEAQDTCKAVNARMGIDEETAWRIVASSMFANAEKSL